MGFKLEIKSVLLNSRNYTVFGLLCIAVGLSLSKPLISLGYIILAFSWFFDGNIKAKAKKFINNKIALMLSGIFVLSVLGLIHTSNFEYGLDDVRRKMSLFVLPFLLSGFSPFTNKELHLLLKTYIIGVLGASFWSFFVYLGGLGIDIYDARDYSRFDSHIRFGLEIVLAIFFSAYYFYQHRRKNKLLWLIILLWLLVSLYIFKLFTGSVVFLFTSLILMFVVGLITHQKSKKYLLVSLFPITIGLSFWFINTRINDFYDAQRVAPIEEKIMTNHGGWYQKDSYTDNSRYKENGYYIERNISWAELHSSWNERSKYDFYGKDLKGNILRHTLIRYITSKGLRKDREAVESLSKTEIKAIEKGVSNVKYLQMNFFSVRMHKIIWEFDNYYNGGEYNGHSVVMRWVYWKTAYDIIKNNFWFGVGTGDVQDAFDEQYHISKTKLKPKYRLRAHNQYLTYFVSFGLIGFLCLLLFLITPIVKTKRYKNYLYMCFFTVICLSMLTEDTLETQVGINLFVFFNTIFLINPIKENHES